MQKCYIMRGLPYSGKSTKARELASEHGQIHSANDYFMVNGVYRYDVRQIRQAHEGNMEAFKKSLEEKVPVVIYDNCNVRIWEFKDCISLAKQFGYEVEILMMPHHLGLKSYREANWRNIPHDKFMTMYQRFENFTLLIPDYVI